jgi:YVTN family beta-propeller protein
LFVTRDDHVDVIETASGKLTGNIPRTAGVHAIAFAPALRRGFTSNGRSNSVSVFELDTLRVAYEVPISGTSPGAILYEPQQNHIFTANRESANLSVLDAGTLQVVATVALPGPPESMATDEAGHVYVNINTAPGRLVMIDAKSLMVKAKWVLKECAGPTAIAIDAMNHRLFSVCANQVMAVTIATVTTQVSARSMALDPATHKIYLATAQFGPPPAASEDLPRARATVVPDSFLILVAQPK